MHVQNVEEKLAAKQADACTRGMGLVEFLIRAGDASISGWSCLDHPKSVADVFEAVVGAAFLDSGEDFLAAFKVCSVHLMVTYR